MSARKRRIFLSKNGERKWRIFGTFGLIPVRKLVYNVSCAGTNEQGPVRTARK